MVQFEASLIELESAAEQFTALNLRSRTAAEIEPISLDPTHATVECEAAEQTFIFASHLPSPATLRSKEIVTLSIFDGLPSHHKIDYYHSWEGVTLLTLYGLPASEFGYVRAITIIRKGRPVPFMTTVLDSDLPTGLITSVAGKSSTVLQKLKYVVRGRRPHEEFESDELDLSGAIPPEIEVTIRRKRSAQLNRKKMR